MEIKALSFERFIKLKTMQDIQKLIMSTGFTKYNHNSAEYVPRIYLGRERLAYGVSRSGLSSLERPSISSAVLCMVRDIEGTDWGGYVISNYLEPEEKRREERVAGKCVRDIAF
jgi:hypothetical protein